MFERDEKYELFWMKGGRGVGGVIPLKRIEASPPPPLICPLIQGSFKPALKKNDEAGELASSLGGRRERGDAGGGASSQSD